MLCRENKQETKKITIEVPDKNNKEKTEWKTIEVSIEEYNKYIHTKKEDKEDKYKIPKIKTINDNYKSYYQEYNINQGYNKSIGYDGNYTQGYTKYDEEDILKYKGFFDFKNRNLNSKKP